MRRLEKKVMPRENPYHPKGKGGSGWGWGAQHKGGDPNLKKKKAWLRKKELSGETYGEGHPSENFKVRLTELCLYEA